MKPPSREGVVIVLDEQAELRIMHSALDDPNLKSLHDDRSPDNWLNPGSLHNRFFRQATSLSVLAGPNYYEEPKIHHGAMFEVLPQDVAILYWKAVKIVREKKTIERIINRFTGKYQAAIAIKQSLTEYLQ